MSKLSKRNKFKEIMTPIVNETKKLPDREGKTYEAAMDNVIIGADYKPGAEVDANGNYIAPHLREVLDVKVLSLGPIADSKIPVGSSVRLMGNCRVNLIEQDERGYIGSIKSHEIIAVVVGE